MIIKFEEHADLLQSREGGKLAKQQFLSLFSTATSENPLVFDFSGVTSISSSFADEFFGKLIRDFGFKQFKEITTFRNVSPFVGYVIRNSIYHRNEKEFVKN